MGRHLPLPFYLDTVENGGESGLKINKILRIVPGKRIVAKAIWNNKIVLAKIFFGHSGWKQAMLRDLRGVTALRQAGIATPKVICQTSTGDTHGAILLMEYLPDAKSFSLLFENASSADEQNVIAEMGIEAIVRCHCAGLWQQDIHLSNFVLSQGKVYVLDGGEIKGNDQALTETIWLQNLAMYLAQFPVAMDHYRDRFIKHYLVLADTVAESAFDRIASQLSQQIVKARTQRLSKFERKLFRSTTALRQVKTRNRFAVYDRAIHCEAIDALIANPDSLLVNAQMLKQGNSSTVAIVEFNGNDYVLKRYNIKSFTHGLKRLFTVSRAHKSWRNTAMLEMLGIDTPHAYVMIEERLLWWFRRRAWFLSEHIKGTNLLELAQQDHAEERIPANFVDKFKHLLSVFRDYRISHGDMKASNFILQDDKLYVLDLDAMQRYKSKDAFINLMQKDRERFSQNWQGSKFEPVVKNMLQELDAVKSI